MNREKIKPRDKEHWLELRKRDITSTDIASLFGLSPYKTRLSLWHQKKDGRNDSIEESDRMRWGKRLERVIAEGVLEEYPDVGKFLIPFDDYIRAPRYRIGSSFDFCVTHPGGNASILEVKNVDSAVYRNQWSDEEAPPHIELQIQHQMLVSGIDVAFIGVLAGGNSAHIIKRKRNSSISKLILDEVERFWISIAKDEQPEPELPRDSSLISRLYSAAEPGKTIDATDEITQLVSEYQQCSQGISELEKNRSSCKSRILMAIGDAERVRGDGFKISAGLIGPSHVEYERKGYRNFKIFRKTVAK